VLDERSFFFLLGMAFCCALAGVGLPTMLIVFNIIWHWRK